MDIDNNIDFITLGDGICNFCEFRIFSDASYPFCKAYPDGIPEEILDGRVDHRKQYKNDKGYRWKYRGD